MQYITHQLPIYIKFMPFYEFHVTAVIFSFMDGVEVSHVVLRHSMRLIYRLLWMIDPFNMVTMKASASSAYLITPWMILTFTSLPMRALRLMAEVSLRPILN